MKGCGCEWSWTKGSLMVLYAQVCVVTFFFLPSLSPKRFKPPIDAAVPLRYPRSYRCNKMYLHNTIQRPALKTTVGDQQGLCAVLKTAKFPTKRVWPSIFQRVMLPLGARKCVGTVEFGCQTQTQHLLIGPKFSIRRGVSTPRYFPLFWVAFAFHPPFFPSQHNDMPKSVSHELLQRQDTCSLLVAAGRMVTN